MALKLNYDFLFAGKDDNSFLENYSYDLYEKYGEKSGEIFINLEIQNNPANSEEIGEAIFGTFQEEFFNRVDEEPYARFEAALKAVNLVLDNFKKQKVSGYIGNLNVVIASYVSGTLYLSQSGDAEAYLIRKKYLSVITEGLSDGNGQEVFSNIASGTVEAGDSVLISSTRLLRYASKNDLGRICSLEDPAAILAEVRDSVSAEMLGKVGLTAICVKEVMDEIAVPSDDDIQGTLVETSTSAKSISTPSGALRVRTVVSKIVYGAKGVVGKVFGKAADKVRERRSMKKARSPRDLRRPSLGISSRVSSFKRGLFERGFGGSKVLIVLGAVLVLLIAGVWIVKARYDHQAELTAVDNLLTEVQNKISESETRGQYDKEAAGQILEKAEQDAMTALNTDFRDKANILLQQIEETRDSLDNVKRIKTPTLVADLTTKRSNVSALGFVKAKDRLFVYEYNAVYELVLDQIQDPVTLDEQETVIAGTNFTDRNSIIFLTKSGKLIEFKDGNIAFLDTDDGSFHKGVALRTWGNKVYIMDPEGNQLWKYTFKGTSSKFGVAAQYTAEGDFATAKDFAIDGNIWALGQTGLVKFYAGAKEDLIIGKKPFSAFKQPLKVVTDADMTQLFVLDATDNRILVFYKDENTKGLIYSNQYVIEGVGEVRDFSVDLNAKRIKVLTATSVYEFDM